MTSSNIIEYTIFNSKDEPVGRHRQNLMTGLNNDNLEKFKPFSEYTILSWGYDEDDEYWEGEKENLEKWLCKNRGTITLKTFNIGDIINVKKIGKCEIIKIYKTFEKDKNWFPIYEVKTSDNKHIFIKQLEIVPEI